MDERSFINTRARFQRLSDARFFTGWVRDLSASAIRIQKTTDVDVKPGEEFMFEVNGHATGAVFPAQLSIANGDDLLFTIPTPLRLVSTYEEARVYVRDVSGVIQGETMEIDVIVVDVSRQGVGVLAPMPLAAGERVTLHLDTPQGPVTCVGEVRYCRPDPKSWGQYRAGLLLEDLGRVERARWARLVGFMPAA